MFAIGKCGLMFGMEPKKPNFGRTGPTYRKLRLAAKDCIARDRTVKISLSKPAAPAMPRTKSATPTTNSSTYGNLSSRRPLNDAARRYARG